MPDPLEPITFTADQPQLEAINDLVEGGSLNRSQVIRGLINSGLAALKGEEAVPGMMILSSLAKAREAIEAVAARLPQPEPALTPSGAYWVPTPDRRPPDTVPAPLLMAEPGRLTVAGIGGVLSIDAEGEQLIALSADGVEVIEKLPLARLARLAASLPNGLNKLAESSEPGSVRVAIRGGLELERPRTGALLISLGAASLAITCTQGWVLAAELASLLARRLAARSEAALRLEASMRLEPTEVSQ